jgi:hypothetical protein
MQEQYVIVRVREAVSLHDRQLSMHGLFGSLHIVTPEEALRLVTAGLAKLPARLTRRVLMEHCATLSSAAEAA